MASLSNIACSNGVVIVEAASNGNIVSDGNTAAIGSVVSAPYPSGFQNGTIIMYKVEGTYGMRQNTAMVTVVPMENILLTYTGS